MLCQEFSQNFRPICFLKVGFLFQCSSILHVWFDWRVENIKHVVENNKMRWLTHFNFLYLIYIKNVKHTVSAKNFAVFLFSSYWGQVMLRDRKKTLTSAADCLTYLDENYLALCGNKPLILRNSRSIRIFRAPKGRKHTWGHPFPLKPLPNKKHSRILFFEGTSLLMWSGCKGIFFILH